MDEKRIWELEGKKNAGEASADEIDELGMLIQNQTEVRAQMDVIAAFWRHSNPRSEKETRDRAFEKLLLRLQNTESLPAIAEIAANKSSLRRRYLGFAVAAAALFLIFFSVLWINMPSHKNDSKKTIIAANGTRSHFALPDGSKIWLNGGSSLTYNQGLDGDTIREVQLAGEAYFEVVHRAEQPFVIHTTQMDIRDVGTSFNVRAYPEDGFSETTLIEGAIEVEFKNKSEKTYLSKPREKIIVYDVVERADNKQTDRHTENVAKDSDQLIRVTKAETTGPELPLAETAWMKDIIVFKNETFRQLANRMERFYDIRIKFEDNELESRRLTGTFSEESFHQALSALQLIIKFHYSIKDHEVFLSI